MSFWQKHPDGGVDEVVWKNFYKERKIAHFADLTEAQRTRLALSANVPQMINAPK